MDEEVVNDKKRKRSSAGAPGGRPVNPAIAAVLGQDMDDDPNSPCRNQTGYIGVRMRKWGMFAAEIRDGDKRRWLGSFTTNRDAGLAYDAAAVAQKGHKAKTNFAYRDYETNPRPNAEMVETVRWDLLPEEIISLHAQLGHLPPGIASKATAASVVQQTAKQIMEGDKEGLPIAPVRPPASHAPQAPRRGGPGRGGGRGRGGGGTYDQGFPPGASLPPPGSAIVTGNGLHEPHGRHRGRSSAAAAMAAAAAAAGTLDGAAFALALNRPGTERGQGGRNNNGAGPSGGQPGVGLSLPGLPGLPDFMALLPPLGPYPVTGPDVPHALPPLPDGPPPKQYRGRGGGGASGGGPAAAAAALLYDPHLPPPYGPAPLPGPGGSLPPPPHPADGVLPGDGGPGQDMGAGHPGPGPHLGLGPPPYGLPGHYPPGPPPGPYALHAHLSSLYGDDGFDYPPYGGYRGYPPMHPMYYDDHGIQYGKSKGHSGGGAKGHSDGGADLAMGGHGGGGSSGGGAPPYLPYGSSGGAGGPGSSGGGAYMGRLPLPSRPLTPIEQMMLLRSTGGGAADAVASVAATGGSGGAGSAAKSASELLGSLGAGLAGLAGSDPLSSLLAGSGAGDIPGLPVFQPSKPAAAGSGRGGHGGLLEALGAAAAAGGPGNAGKQRGGGGSGAPGSGGRGVKLELDAGHDDSGAAPPLGGFPIDLSAPHAYLPPTASGGGYYSHGGTGGGAVPRSLQQQSGGMAGAGGPHHPMAGPPQGHGGPGQQAGELHAQGHGGPGQQPGGHHVGSGGGAFVRYGSGGGAPPASAAPPAAAEQPSLPPQGDAAAEAEAEQANADVHLYYQKFAELTEAINKITSSSVNGHRTEQSLNEVIDKLQYFTQIQPAAAPAVVGR